MMKPLPSEVTCWGRPPRPRKFLNSSDSGESGGRSGSAPLGGAFRVCEVEMFTTAGSSLAVRSAKESGAGRAKAGAAARQKRAKTAARKRMGGYGLGFGTGV